MSLLARLRTDTREYHESLEARSPMRAIMDGTLTPEAYQDILQRFYGLHVPIEQHFVSRPEWHELNFDITPRLRVPLIRDDLRALGLHDDTINTLPHIQRLPPLETFPHILGCLYVLEGSTLGGQLLSRKLVAMQLPGVTAEHGSAFFASYGPKIGEMWKAFGEMLVAYAAQHQADDEIIQAACQTYEVFEHALCDEIATPVS